MKTVAFLGTGNMGRALIQAACNGIGADEVVITNRTLNKAEDLAEELGCACAKNNIEAVQQATCIFLCMKPHMIREVLEEIAPYLEGKFVVCVAAGVQISAMAEVAPKVPILRVMPNTCCAIGKGMLAITSDPALSADAYYAIVGDILRFSGRIERISENLMDQFTAVAGCGPAYVYQFIEALADGGVMAGLPRREAQIYAAQTVMGAAAMVLETEEHPGALKDAVCSPGGSTIAGVAMLERHGLRSAVIDAVMAAYEKNIALGK